jgi:hypothetical protein
MKLKGTLGYYKVETEGIAQTIVTSKQLNKNVVFILSGKMTPGQHSKVSQHYKVGPELLMNALRGLIPYT